MRFLMCREGRGAGACVRAGLAPGGRGRGVGCVHHVGGHVTALRDYPPMVLVGCGSGMHRVMAREEDVGGCRELSGLARLPQGCLQQQWHAWLHTVWVSQCQPAQGWAWASVATVHLSRAPHVYFVMHFVLLGRQRCCHALLQLPCLLTGCGSTCGAAAACRACVRPPCLPSRCPWCLCLVCVESLGSCPVVLQTVSPVKVGMAALGLLQPQVVCWPPLTWQWPQGWAVPVTQVLHACMHPTWQAATPWPWHVWRGLCACT